MFTKRTPDTDIVELSLRDGIPPRMSLHSVFDLDARKAQAEKQAQTDAASGAYDQIAVEVLPVLPYEQLIDDEIRVLQRNAAQDLPASTLDPSLELAIREAAARRDREQEMLQVERAKRRELTRVLNGEKKPDGKKTTADDVDWSGTDPAAPTSDGFLRIVLRSEVLRAWMISFGLTAVLLFAETYVMMRNVKMFIRGETDLFAGILALVLALIMTMIPHAIGTAVLTARRREVGMNSREKLTIFLLTPFWISVGVLIGYLRTMASQRHAVIAAATDLEISPDQVVVSQVFQFWPNFALWTAIALGVGFAIFAVKCFTYNPYRTQAIKLDTAIALRERRLHALAEAADAQAEIEAERGRDEVAHFDAYRRMYGEALPAAGDLVRSHYRATLIRLVAQPDFTTALAISGRR